MRKVLIESQENPYSLSVKDADTGEIIENVTAVSFTMRADNPHAQASIQVYNPKLKIFGYAGIEYICPYCNNGVPME